MVISSWVAWRRSPLYSVKTTLKIVGAFILVVASVIGMTRAFTSDLVSGSPVMEGVLIGIGIIAIGTGATGLLIRITDSHIAQVPASVRIVHTYRHQLQRWIWHLVMGELICAAAGASLPSSWSWAPLGLGGFVLLGCGPMLMGFYMRARRLDFGMTAVMAAPWAHWQYTQAEWQTWAVDQLAFEKSKIEEFSWRQWLIFLAFLVGILAVGALFAGGSLGENLIIVGGMTTFIMLLVTGLTSWGRLNLGRRNRHLLAASKETWFGAEGVFCNGEFVPWTLSGGYLIEATVQHEAPGRLMLVFQTFNGSTSALQVRRALIPEGSGADLEMLQQKLRETCRTASVHLLAPPAAAR